MHSLVCLVRSSKFHKIVDKIMLKCISAPEAADPTNAWRLLPPVFRKGRMKGQEITVKRRLSRHALDRK